MLNLGASIFTIVFVEVWMEVGCCHVKNGLKTTRYRGSMIDEPVDPCIRKKKNLA
jgi:hypothetical protein